MVAPFIELKDIRKSFGPADVLKGVNLKVYPGQVSALVGDNGAGKSTLIKGLAGVQTYDSGEVLVDGAVVGVLTSGNFSPVLGHSIGLAFLKSGRERIGEKIVVWDGLRGEETLAEVCSPVFVDAENKKLHV